LLRSSGLEQYGKSLRRPLIILNAPDGLHPFFLNRVQRELIFNLAVTADYIHCDGLDQFLTINLNQGRRATTSSTAVITRQFSASGAVIKTTLFGGNGFVQQFSFQGSSAGLFTTRVCR